ncbi:MAG: protein kinase [Nitrospiraceae bacterium]|nr:protein kinase [Nitrospiraceae bacterium]
MADDEHIEHNDEIRVTERLPDAPPDPPVTGRMPDGRPTDRFEAEPASTAPSQAPGVLSVVKDGELVDDRYRIEGARIGEVTGEGDLFRGTDTQTGDTVALKFYRSGLSPKGGILDSLFNIRHPHIVTLRAYGMWAGRFYEVMDYCAGGSLVDHMPFDEAALEDYLRQLLAALQYLHAQGIVHRDIKPSNVFFRENDARELVVGDFGVSSILEADEKVRKTSTGAFFTLDYAAPELIDGKEVSPKTDYYALGVTFLHLLTGCSPFTGMDKNAILGSHFRGRVPRPEGLSERFAQLVGGLLRIDPDKRWGYRQVLSWLDDEPVLNDEGRPDREEIFTGKNVPYRSLPSVTQPAEMALRMNEFDAEKDLRRGFISQWAMFFDTQLGERIAELEEEYEDDTALAVFKLRYLLDPTLPLIVGNRELYTVGQLTDLIDDPARSHHLEIEELLYSGATEVWVEAMGYAGARGDLERVRELAKRIETIRTRVKKRGLGVFTLLYVLDPARPLRLGATLTIRGPEEIEDAILKHPRALQRLSQYLYGGYFGQWLRLAFPQRRDDIAFVDECIVTHKDDREQGVFALRCRFQPNIPVRCGTGQANTPKELAALINRGPEGFERGMRMLADGSIRTWLATTGRMEDTAAFDEIVNDYTTSRERKMEAVLHILDPDLSWPTPAADAEFIDAGTLTTEMDKVVQVCIFNAGRGHLAGTVTLIMADAERTGAAGGFTMEERELRGGPLEVSVTLHGRGGVVGARHEARIVADTNGGRIEIPIYFQVSAPLPRMLLRSALAGLVVALILGMFRLTLQACLPEYTFSVMDWFDWTYIAAHLHQWGFVPAALLVVGGLAAAAYLIYMASPVRD